jgi:DNA protecting protein DprA
MIVQTPTIEFVAFCLQAAPGVGVSTLRTILARITREGLTPDALLQLDDHDLLSRLGLNPSAINALRSPRHETLKIWQRLEEESVKILVRGQPDYPERLLSLLGDTSPPILFLLGEIDLFQRRAVGFCGSRKASDKGLSVANACASLLARQQINIISGYAHGVDLAAHRAALEAGGTTTVVLAEGILHFKIKSELRDLVNKGDFSRLSVVSEFPPGLSWRAHNAMVRNRTICGLSHAMVVIESGCEGGTFEAGKAALELGEPLFCVEYSEMPPQAAGNPYFLSHGAQSLRRSRDGEPNLTKLLAVVRNAGDNPPQDRQQELLLSGH